MVGEPYNPLDKLHLGESVAKAHKILEGFGNHDPGAGRYNQQRAPWDVIHPGRPWAPKLKPNARSRDEFLKNIAEFLKI